MRPTSADEAKKKPEVLVLAQRFREKLVRIEGAQERAMALQLPRSVEALVKLLEEEAGFDDLQDEMLMARLTRDFERRFLSALRRAFWVS